MEFLTTSDIMAGMIGCGWSSVYNISNPMMLGIRAIVISVIARIASQNGPLATAMPNMTADMKNQLLVAVCGGIASYYKKGNPVRGALSSVSIDLISIEVLKLMKMDDTVIVGNK